MVIRLSLSAMKKVKKGIVCALVRRWPLQLWRPQLGSYLPSLPVSFDAFLQRANPAHTLFMS